jgi:hypothetical protein
LANPLQHLQQPEIENQKPVLGMPNDIRDIIRVQPEVQCMKHCPHGRHTEIRLHMLRLIPHEGGDPVPWLDTCALQGSREPSRTSMQIPHCGSRVNPVGFRRDNVRIPEQLPRALQNAGHQQRAPHHRRLHESSPSSAASQKAAQQTSLQPQVLQRSGKSGEYNLSTAEAPRLKFTYRGDRIINDDVGEIKCPESRRTLLHSMENGG